MNDPHTQAPFLNALGPNARVADLATGVSGDLRFWSPKENEWDGVWANHVFNKYKPEETQRVVASAFRGLKPGGVMGVILDESKYSEKQICSMIEQTGFKILQVGRRQKETTSELLVVAKRI